MREANFTYAFFLFWMACCFVICFCSSHDINSNILPQVSSPPENVSESQHQSPEPLKKDTKDEVDKRIPPDKEHLQINLQADEKNDQNVRSEQVPERSNGKQETDASSMKPLESAESTEAAATKVDEAKGTKPKKDSNVDKEDSQPEPSNNVEKPTVVVTGNTEQNMETSVVSDDPKTPKAAVVEEKMDNQSETQTSRDAVKGGTGSDPPEDGSDVPTFGEYQRKFTGKHDGAGKEFKNGAKHEDPVKGGSVVTQPDKTEGATTPQPGNGAAIGSVGRFKNVGSTSCGAKVIANNDEASNPAHILNENRDEYMNHPCTAKKWFVVEACEPVRLRQVDIGSYELFSSMVKTFRISASERFPQKLWDMIGTFTAKNEKGVQTYRVEQDKYYKYFKFEILDHYGNEHFCPLSLIRLYGVLVEDDDGDDEQAQDGDGNRNAAMQDGNEEDRNMKDQENSRSLLQSATKVLVDIVKKTLQPKNSQDAANQQSPEEGMSTESTTPTPQPPLSRADGSSEREGHMDTRLSQLIKLLMSGEYSSLLKHCLDLLRRSPTVEQKLMKDEYIPSPSMAFVECSRVAFKARLSSKDLRWAYLLYNNATSSWEPEKRAALFGEMGTASGEIGPHSGTVSETGGGKQEDKGSNTDANVKTERATTSQTETSSDAKSQKNEKTLETDGATVAKSQPPTPSGSSEMGERSAAKVTDGKDNQGDGKTVANTAQSTPVSEESGIQKTEGTNSSNRKGPETEQLKALPKVPMDNSAKTSGESDQNTSSSKPDTEQRPKEEAKTEDEKVSVNQKLQKEDGKDSSEKTAEVSQESQTQHQSKVQENQTSTESPKASPSREKPSEKVKVDETVPKPNAQTKNQEPPQTTTKSKVGDSVSGSNGRTLGIKENAYMRLSNKLRAMEINITMSMAYLEELSRSYKKKTDKISKQMEVALQKLEETVSLGEERDRTQQKRLLVMDKQIEELRIELKLTEAKMRQENTLMRHGILLQAVTLNAIVFLVHILVTLYCSRRQRSTNDMRPAGCGALQNCSSNSMSRHSVDRGMNGNLHSVTSNSDTNLYIVDPPFRLEEHIVKKDGKKKKKRKKNVASSQQGSLYHNQFRDRSASESRIEDLL